MDRWIDRHRLRCTSGRAGPRGRLRERRDSAGSVHFPTETVFGNLLMQKTPVVMVVHHLHQQVSKVIVKDAYCWWCCWCLAGVLPVAGPFGRIHRPYLRSQVVWSLEAFS